MINDSYLSNTLIPHYKIRFIVIVLFQKYKKKIIKYFDDNIKGTTVLLLLCKTRTSGRLKVSKRDILEHWSYRNFK